MNKFLTIFLCALSCAAAAGAEEPLSAPGLISKEEEAARDTKVESEFAAALAKLPAFSRECMEHILKTLRDVEYPVEHDLLEKKLGGPDALVWTSTSFRGTRSDFHRQISIFRVSASSPEYRLVLDYAESAIDLRSSKIARARLCYFSPFGGIFVAESMEEFLGFEDTTAKKR